MWFFCLVCFCFCSYIFIFKVCWIRFSSLKMHNICRNIVFSSHFWRYKDINYFIISFFLRFCFFGLSHYMTLTLTRLWHYLTLTLIVFWNFLIFFLRFHFFVISFSFRVSFFLIFHFFWDFNIFILRFHVFGDLIFFWYFFDLKKRSKKLTKI